MTSGSPRIARRRTSAGSIPGGALRQAIAPARVIGAVISSSNEVVAPGVIVNDTPRRNMLTVGEANDADSRRIADLRAALAAAEIESPAVAEIRLAIWRKLVINMTASILCLLTGHKATVVRDDERIGALFGRAIGEAIAVARAHGMRWATRSGKTSAAIRRTISLRSARTTSAAARSSSRACC